MLLNYDTQRTDTGKEMVAVMEMTLSTRRLRCTESVALNRRSSEGVVNRARWTHARQRNSHMIVIRQGGLASLSICDHKMPFG
jgi:hypothetical protein